MPIINDAGQTSIDTIRTTISGGSNKLSSYYKTPNGPTPTSYTLVPTSGTIAYSMFRSGVIEEDITPYTYRVGLKTGVSRASPMTEYIPSGVQTMIVRTSNNSTDQAGQPTSPDNFNYWQFPISGKTIGDFFDWIRYGGTGGRTGGRAYLLQKSDGSVYCVINGKNPDGTSTADNSGGPAATGSGGNIMFLEKAKYADGTSATSADAGAYQMGIPVTWSSKGRPNFTDDCFNEMFGPVDPTKTSYILNSDGAGTVT